MGHHHNHHLLRFHHQYHIGSSSSKKEGTILPPKGCMAIRVGQKEEEQQRFVVPVVYLNHPLFIRLLKEAEEEYGFEHKGAIAIPCHVEYFRKVRGIIDRESGIRIGSREGGGEVNQSQQHLHFHISGCFKAS